MKRCEKSRKISRIRRTRLSPAGPKIVADILDGSAYGLSRRREIWVKHGISAFEIPISMYGTNVRMQARPDASFAEHSAGPPERPRVSPAPDQAKRVEIVLSLPPIYNFIA